MSKAPALRQEDLDEYILFRWRLGELIDLFKVWARYGNLPDENPEKEISSTVGIAVQVWLYSFFDDNPRALNVLRLWPNVFPATKAKVRAWAATNETLLQLLEDFRHTTGAHFSRKIEDHLRVRKTFTMELVGKAIDSFIDLAQEVTTHEPEQPELIEAIKRYGLPPGLKTSQ